MATKLVLAVAALAFAALADPSLDAVAAKDVAKAFEEALMEEAPLLKIEEKKAEGLLKQALVRTHLRASNEAPAPVATSSETGEWASTFEKDVSDLVMGLSKGGFGATPMGDSVGKIAALIEKDMMPKVLKAHDDDQKELIRLAKDIETCGTTKTIELAAADKRKVTYQSSSTSHKSCRSDEAALYTENVECHKDWKSAKEAKVLKCQAYLAVSKKYGESAANQEIVKKAGSEDVESYVRRITTTICGKPVTCPKCDAGRKGGMLDDLLDHKKKCEDATKKYNDIVKKCKDLDAKWHSKRSSCDGIQDTMDTASCKWATESKDACEAYAGCYKVKRALYDAKEKNVSKPTVGGMVIDRKAEWRGLNRMKCLIDAFGDGSVTTAEVDGCKKKNHSTDVINGTTTGLNIVYPKVPDQVSCAVPQLFPTTASYKKAEFVPLPTLAKGKLDANECTSLKVISITPQPGSPPSCKCERVSMNGPFTPGPLVKCSNCLDVSNSKAKNSCPGGTKLFSPRSRQDWETFLKSASPLRAPNWIVDVTRPFNGCVDCAVKGSKEAGGDPSDDPAAAMNSDTKEQTEAPLSQRWQTTDGSPWWLRSSKYMAPTGDYSANCYLDLFGNPANADSVSFKDDKCNYHAKSYYCQPLKLSLKPKAGSPTGCTCKKVELMGQYSAQLLIKCSRCLDVYKSNDKNSCPSGSKIFSPRTRADWKTFLSSATPLRSPHWIIDVTRPQNGCGGCTSHAMNSGVAAQATWVTSDRSPWWLRSVTYEQPNGDYTANCYMNLWNNPANENSVTFDDGNCNYHSSSYYCQSLKTTTTTTTTAKVLISKIFNNLNGGSTKHTSSITSSWATHIFPIKTGLPSGTLVTPGTMYYRLGTSSKFTSNCKIGSGMSSGNKDLVGSIGATSTTISKTTIAGQTDNFYQCKFGGQVKVGSGGKLWLYFKYTGGSGNHRKDIGPSTFTDSYYQKGFSRTGLTSFYFSLK